MRNFKNAAALILILMLVLPALASASTVEVTWNANTETDLAGYKIHLGTQSGNYSTTSDVGKVTACDITDAAPGTTYYIALSAYNTSDLESTKSDEVSITVPVPDTNPPAGSFVINAGAATTPSRVVTLTLAAADNEGAVAGMRISNDGTNWTNEAAYATSQTWALTEGDGVKTVYVNFKDAAGNWMATPATATITLALDTDGDGLTDAWETAYGLDINNPSDASDDEDLDGYSNLEEYYNGTNPVSSADGAPSVNAGTDLQTAPTLVTLSGTATDPRGLSLQYSWSLVSGPASVTIDNASSATASFVGTTAGVYTFRLTCYNGRAYASDTTNVTITNVAPTVDAGSDVTVDSGTAITLHATGADSNGDALSYQWTLTQGTGVALPYMDQQDIDLTIGTAGQYRFSVTCSDGSLNSTADEVIVTVNAVNHAPTANAGEDQSVTAGQQVVLNGTGSTDPDGDTLGYSWTQVSGTAVALGNAKTSSAYFTPTVAGAYVFGLVVSDGKVQSTSDTVTITVVNQNNAPVADAGSDITAFVGSQIVLDASSSYDSDGDGLSYSWSQTSGATVVLSNAKTASPTFAPTTSGVLVFTVTVSDGQVTSLDSVQVTVNDVNNVPVAEAGANQTVQVGATVTLDGSSSTDADGDTLSYTWSQTSGTNVSLSSPSSAVTTFVPTAAGTYVFELKVYDGIDTSTADTMTVTVQQAEVAISMLTPQAGAIVSSNPTFTWSASGMTKYKVYITLDKKRYSNIYNGTGTSCRMNSSLWNWFIASGSTIYWYIEGTTVTGLKEKSALSSFRKK